MKLIIDIPDNEYKHIKEYYEKNDTVEAIYSYIYHGIPLEEPFINKPCISEKVCHEDKIKALDKLKIEIEDHTQKIDIKVIDDEMYVRFEDIQEMNRRLLNCCCIRKGESE